MLVLAKIYFVVECDRFHCPHNRQDSVLVYIRSHLELHEASAFVDFGALLCESVDIGRII